MPHCAAEIWHVHWQGTKKGCTAIPGTWQVGWILFPNIDTKWNELQDSESESDTNFITNHGSTLILQNAGYSCWRSVFVPDLNVEVKPHHCWRILDCQRCQAKEPKRTADSLEDFQRHSWHLAILKMIWHCALLSCEVKMWPLDAEDADGWPIRGLLDKCHAFGNLKHFTST